MFKSKIAILISTMFIILFSGHLMAASHQIDMLNKLGKERMVFSKKVISVDVNDDVSWKSVNKGHNVEFIGMPEGVKKYKSKISKDAKYKFVKPGIYLYQCTPHKAMGMIGIVVVGNDKSNLEKIKKIKVRGKSKKLLKSLLADL
jgi:pseudoazurin|tara:strand:- start:2 stop:436 length:435 start_codon:yes stop_codon:yes gene_type:complete